MIDSTQPWWKRSKSPLLLVFAVAFLVNIPYLGGGFAADDILFLDMLYSDPRPFHWWGGFWSVRGAESWDHIGYAAFRPLWWHEPGTLGSFWRPLFTFVFAASVFVFGENAVPLHILSLAAHGGVAVCLVLLVRRLSARSGLGLIAGLLYATCEDHSLGVGWISTMTDMLCVLFIMLALLGHLRWLRDRQPIALLLSMVALLLAFMSKESAAVAPLVLVGLTVVAPRGEAEEIDGSIAGLRGRALATLRDPASWAPQGGALVLYLGVYKALGFGGMNNLMYLDPFGNPIAYLRNVVVHGPVMWLATLSPASPSMASFIPGVLPIMAIAGVVGFILWLFFLWPHRKDGLALWAFGSYFVALLPQLSTDASERGLYFPFIGAAILLALILARLRAAGSRWQRAAAWVVLLSIAIPGVVMSVVMPFSMMGSFAALDRQVKSALPYVSGSQAKPTLFLNTSGAMVTIYVGGILEHEADNELDLHLLSSCNAVVSLERTGDDTFVIRADRAGWLSNMFARLVRKEPTFAVGRSYENRHFDAEVLEVTDDGSDVLAIRFRFKSIGDDILFLRWDGERFLPFDMGALAVGESTVLADTSDVWASMM